MERKAAMSISCPYCDQTLLDEEAEECPHCHGEFGPPVIGKYIDALTSLEDATDKITAGALRPEVAQQLVAHVTGIFQTVLDQASEEINSNLRKAREALNEIPEEARIHWMEYASRFSRLQRLVNDRLVELADLWDEPNPNHLAIQTALGKFQNDLNEIEMLVQETSKAALMEVPDEPLPKEVTAAIERFENCMDQINLYCAGRDKADLEEALVHLDEARRLIKLTLMMGAYDE